MELSIWQIVFRLVVAGVLGGAVGYERERADKPAGLRTHMIVCVASTLIMLLSIHVSALYPGRWFDPGRIAAQVISGMGFLGAGTIIRQGNIVRGLTTAASLWFVAGLGLAIGAGFYFASVISVAIVLILFLFNMERLLKIKRPLSIEIEHRGGRQTTAEVMRRILELELDLAELSAETLFGGRSLIEVRLAHPLGKEQSAKILASLNEVEKVTGVTVTD